MTEVPIWTQKDGKIRVPVPSTNGDRNHTLLLPLTAIDMFHHDPLDLGSNGTFSDSVPPGGLDEMTHFLHDLFPRYTIYPLLTKNAEAVLLVRYLIQGDEAARQRLILSNIGLVVDIAKKYNTPYIDFVDIVSAGISGLIRAIDEFNFTKALKDDGSLGKLSTYATFTIRKAIQVFFAKQAHIMSVSTDFLLFMGKVKDIADALKIDFLGEYVPTQMIALELLEEEVEYIILTISDIQEGDKKRYELLVEKVELGISLLRRDSLDRPVFESDALLLVDTLKDDSMPIEEQIVRRELIKIIEGILADSSISPRDREIFLMYYTSSETTLKQVGESFGLTKERIRQIVNECKSVLKHSRYRRRLEGYH